MGRAFVLLLTSNSSLSLKETSEKKSMCTKIGQFYYTECNLKNGSLSEQIIGNPAFCGNGNLKVFHLHAGVTTGKYIRQSEAMLELRNITFEQTRKFVRIIKTLAGKKRSLILLSAGVILRCNASDAISRIEPGINYLKDFYGVNSLKEVQNGTIWPQIIYLSPDMPGITKQTKYVETQGREICNKFAENMKKYCDKIGIPVLDFRKVTTGIHSYDGTHYGIGVNMMKVNILLNYLDASFTSETYSKPT